jgi:hypothetical protein
MCQNDDARSAVLFELTYRRAWRLEVSGNGQWCDFLVEEKEVGAGQFPACATS